MFAGIGGIQLEMMAAGLFLPVHAKVSVLHNEHRHISRTLPTKG
jgi:hypothetical protein